MKVLSKLMSSLWLALLLTQFSAACSKQLPVVDDTGGAAGSAATGSMSSSASTDTGSKASFHVSGNGYGWADITGPSISPSDPAKPRTSVPLMVDIADPGFSVDASVRTIAGGCHVTAKFRNTAGDLRCNIQPKVKTVFDLNGMSVDRKLSGVFYGSVASSNGEVRHDCLGPDDVGYVDFADLVTENYPDCSQVGRISFTIDPTKTIPAERPAFHFTAESYAYDSAKNKLSFTFVNDSAETATFTSGSGVAFYFLDGSGAVIGTSYLPFVPPAVAEAHAPLPAGATITASGPVWSTWLETSHILAFLSI